MKKRGLLQHTLAGIIASMGHTDLLVIADAGLPVPPGVACIDLAVRCGLPSMLDVTRTVAEELQVEEIFVADELLRRDEVLPKTLQ
jgi:D-ribose pyranase